MVWQYVVAAGVVYKLLNSSDLDHDETVQATYDELVDEVPSDATLYADHISDGQNPRNVVDGLNRVPDLVVTSQVANSLLVEVETAESLAERRAEARSQLRDFSKRGYRRVLVIPPSEEEEDVVKEFISEEFDSLDGELYFATPGGVARYL